MPSQPSIRDHLESDAWRNHPGFARRCSNLRNSHDESAPARSRRSLSWQDRALLILSAVLLLLLIIRVETARAGGGGDEFWGLEFHGDAGSRQMVALDTEIQAEVTGLTARVEVSQVFTNTGMKWAEAIYRYPLPEGAAVDSMRIEVGGRILEGEIQEKAEARRRYQQARASGRTASLLEQQRVNQFETRLANIGPGDEIRVFIGFLARVDFRDGIFGLSIPMTFTPRWEGVDAAGTTEIAGMARSHMSPSSNNAPAPLIAPADRHFLTVEVNLRTGMNLASLESRYHDVDIHPGLDGYHLFLADPDTRTDRVFELNWTPEFGAFPESTLMTFDGDDGVYALLMLVPPLVEAIAPQPREVVFIIDTSGSMEGTSIDQARAALRQGLRYLGPDDRFNLIEFNSNASVLFEESVPAYPSFLDEAADFIDGLSANGGTVMAPALNLAMGLPEQNALLRQIVFITDGSVGNEQDLLLQIGEQLRDSRLFTVSIGSAPNAWFMRKAAEIGRGSHSQIGKLDEVEERMSSLWARIENPAIQNICVDWGMDAEFYPEIIPDLYAGEPLWLHARLPLEPREVTLCGELDGRYWETVSRVLPGSGGGNLESLWARSKVEALEDSRIFGANPDDIRLAVLDLALEFRLLTQYTSLIAVDKTPTRPVGAGLDSSEIPSLLPAGSSLATGFSQTATGWLTQLVLAFISVLLTTGMLLYRPPSRAKAGGDRLPMATSVQ
jgi:Ca-activated chloride channel family protein